MSRRQTRWLPEHWALPQIPATCHTLSE
jgi:hypothetical protein